MKCSMCGREIKKGKKYWELPSFRGFFCSKVCIANRAIDYFNLEEKVRENERRKNTSGGNTQQI